MIFADKLIRLRKRNGWSQEELAEKMGTSRQAVSKWEGAQSVPDIGKILQLGQLFGVTTDYLLKDEIEDEEFCGDDSEPAVKHVSLSDAAEYLAQRKKASVLIAFATFLCILSPVPLILLGAASEVPQYGISENLAGIAGLVLLFVLVATAVPLFIYCGFVNGPYEFLEKEPFVCEYGVTGLVREKQKNYRHTYVILNIIGVLLCVLSPIPLFIGAFTEKDFLTVMMLAVTILVAGIGTVLLIIAGVRMAGMQRLLKEGEFSEKEKKTGALKETVSTVYWLLAVGIYLAISLPNDRWETSWIVWPIAGVLFAAVMVICNLVAARKDKTD